MVKKISKLMVTLAVVFGLGTALVAPVALIANTANATTTLKEQTFPVDVYLDLDSGKDGTQEQAQSYFKDPKKNPTVEFLVKVLELAIKIAGTLAVLLLIGTGLTMVMSQGSQDILEKAKQMFLYEIIGLIVIFLSYVAITFVQSIFTTT